MNNAPRQFLRIGGLLTFSLVGAAGITGGVLALLVRHMESVSTWAANEVAVQPGISFLLPANGAVRVRWVSPPLDPQLVARASVPLMTVDARGNPWLLRDERQLVCPTLQAAVALSQPCRDVVGLSSGALVLVTASDWGFMIATQVPADGEVALATEVFQPVAALPVAPCRAFSGTAGQLYLCGYNAQSSQHEVYRVAPEPAEGSATSVVRRYELLFTSGQPVRAVAGDATADYFAVDDTLYRRPAAGGAVQVIHCQDLQPITGLAVDAAAGVFFTTTAGAFRLNEGGALPVAQVVDAQIAVRNGSLYLLLPSCLGIVALDNVAELRHARAEQVDATPAPDVWQVRDLRLAAVKPGDTELEPDDTFDREMTRQIDCEVRLVRRTATSGPERHVVALQWSLPDGRVFPESAALEIAPGKKEATEHFRGLPHSAGKYHPGWYRVTANVDGAAPVESSFNITGNLSLAEAVERDDVDAARILLQGGAEAGGEFARGVSLLTYAVEGASVAMTELLLKYGANPHAIDSEGRTPLFHAALAKADGAEKARALLAYRAVKDARDRNGWTALFHAVAEAQSYLVADALLVNKADPNLPDKIGRTPLIALMDLSEAIEQHAGLAQLLLAGGADVQATDERGLTALHAVLQASCSPAGVRVLIDGGADVNATAPDGRLAGDEPSSCLASALAACRENRETNRAQAQKAMAVAQMLLDAGAQLQPHEEALVIEPEFCSWLDESFIRGILDRNESVFETATIFPERRVRPIVITMLLERLAARVGQAASPAELQGAGELCRQIREVARSGYTIRTPSLARPAGTRADAGLHVTFQDGVCRIVSVNPGSPAAAAGLESGDIVTAVDGAIISTEAELAAALAATPANTNAELIVQRDDEAAVPELYFWCGALARQLNLPADAEADLRTYLRLGENPAALAQAREWVAALGPH